MRCYEYKNVKKCVDVKGKSRNMWKDVKIITREMKKKIEK